MTPYAFAKMAAYLALNKKGPQGPFLFLLFAATAIYRPDIIYGAGCVTVF
jgi:hypothetical protein